MKAVRWEEVGDNIGENKNVKFKYVEKQGWLLLELMQQLVLGLGKRRTQVGFCSGLVFLFFRFQF